MINQFHIGAFFFLIKLGSSWHRFLVDSFSLTKGVGSIGRLSVEITDSTDTYKAQHKAANISVSSMQVLMEDVVADVSQLRQCRMVEYRPKGTDYEEIQWFTGRLCSISPRVDTSTGIRVGMSCQCLSKACQLAYRPFVDFVYTPANFASDIDALQTFNVFYPDKILTKMFSAQEKLSPMNLISKAGINKELTIVDMLARAVKTIQLWLKKQGQTKQVLASMPELDLSNYVQGNLKLAPVLRNKLSADSHPYVTKLIEDFVGSMQSVTLLDSLINTLGSDGRQLTIVPAGRKDTSDKLTVIPWAIDKYREGNVISPQQIIFYALGADPRARIRQPDKIFVKAPFLNGWGSQDNTGDLGTYKTRSAVGQYSILPESKSNQDMRKIKLLYAPKWLFDIVLLGSYTTKDNGLVHRSLYINAPTAKPTQTASSNAQPAPIIDIQQIKNILDAYAKNMFFSTYRQGTQANIGLVISQQTLNLDTKLGKSIKIQVPTSAKNTVNKNYSNFYGRLQSIMYTYQAAKSFNSSSLLSLTCMVTAVTSQKSQGMTLFKEGSNILYETSTNSQNTGLQPVRRANA